MRIAPTTSVAPAAARRVDRAGGSGGAFATHLPHENAAAAATSGAAQLTAVQTLLAIQETPDATRGRSRGLKRGSDLLARLDEIRHGLLLGEIPLPRLLALEAALKQESEAVADPELHEILGEIELRCAVELAKLGR